MKRNNKGFTLAEMLIVVAIIGVLIAIVTTTISNSLEKAREATDLANIRSAYAQLSIAVIDDSNIEEVKLNNNNGQLVGKVVKAKETKNGHVAGTYVSVIEMKQTQAGWQSNFNKQLVTVTDSNGIETVWELKKNDVNKKYLYIGMNKDGKICRISCHDK